jgi:hypothetical protein
VQRRVVLDQKQFHCMTIARLMRRDGRLAARRCLA